MQEEQIKEAFQKVKEDFFSLRQEVDSIKTSLWQMIEVIERLKETGETIIGAEQESRTYQDNTRDSQEQLKLNQEQLKASYYNLVEFNNKLVFSQKELERKNNELTSEFKSSQERSDLSQTPLIESQRTLLKQQEDLKETQESLRLIQFNNQEKVQRELQTNQDNIKSVFESTLKNQEDIDYNSNELKVIKQAQKELKQENNEIIEKQNSLNKENKEFKEILFELKKNNQFLQELLESQINRFNEFEISQEDLKNKLFPAHNPEVQTIQQIIPTGNSTPTDNLPFKGLKEQDIVGSIGNGGVPTDRQTNQQTDRQTHKTGEKQQIQENSIEKASEILSSLDNIKKELRFKFKRLTEQEVLVFSSIYQLDEESKSRDKGDSLGVDYKLVADQLNLTESSIRDYVGKLIKKGVPVEKTKLNNKKVSLSISDNLKKIASLATILQLREL